MKTLALLVLVCGIGWGNQYDRDRALQDQAAAQEDQAYQLRRIAQAQEMANATASAPAPAGEACERMEGGAVPEGCQLKFLRTNAGEIATGKGPDGKRHAIYLLYCAGDR